MKKISVLLLSFCLSGTSALACFGPSFSTGDVANALVDINNAVLLSSQLEEYNVTNLSWTNFSASSGIKGKCSALSANTDFIAKATTKKNKKNCSISGSVYLDSATRGKSTSLILNKVICDN